ncbi:MAG: glycosyltransferase [Bacteroidia bacterium]
MWKKPKILMLGWEYPPYFNGGLGVACQGLVKAISPFTRLTMIVPKTGVFPDNEQVKLIGLNELGAVTKAETSEWVEQQWETLWVDTFLNPYETEKAPVQVASEKKLSKTELTSYANPFVEEALYEGDLRKRVMDYTRIVLEQVKGKEFDLIHAHDWMTFPAALALQAATGKPLIVHLHSTEYDRAGKDSKGWVYQMEKEAMEKADFVIPVSQYAANILTEHYKIEATKIHPIHNAIDKKQAFKSEKSFKERLVAFVGRITYQKGPDTFLKIAMKVLEQHDNVRFVMAGRGDMQDALMEEVIKHRISHRFHFAGFLEKAEVEKLLSMADVFVMPSVSEPFGIAALEAAQFGVPCIISRQAGCLEILTAALTADSQDVELMADYILELLHSASLSEEIGRINQASVQALSWEKVGTKVLEVYEKALGK